MGPQKQPLVRVRRKHTLSTQRTSVQTAAKVRYPPFVSNDMNGPIRTFVHGAANGRSEPTLPDAALRANVQFSRNDQKPAKTKRSFAKGLWHKNIEWFRTWRHR